MGLKTNELQQLEAVLGTDSLLADTAAAGTGRVPIAKLAEFLANGDNAVKTALLNKVDGELPKKNMKVRGTGNFNPPKAGWYRIASQPNPTRNTPTYIQLGFMSVYNHTPSLAVTMMIHLDEFAPNISVTYASCLGTLLTADKIRITQKNDIEQGPCYLDIHIAVPDNFVNIVMSTFGVYDNNSIIVNQFIPVKDAPENETVIKICNIAAMPSGSVAVAAPPVWHDLQLTAAFLPDGDNAVNQYCKDQFGRVTVRLQCKTAAEAGISSEHNIAVLPAGFRPRGGQMLTCLFRDNQSSQTGYIHVYTSGTIASGQLHNGGSLKKINCEFSYFAE